MKIKMGRYFILLYGVVGYLIGLLTLLYMVAWLYPWDFIPSYIDSNPKANIITSTIIDIALITLFGLQHSLMVRASFKDFMSKYLSLASIRVTYTIISSIFLALIIIFWYPIDIKVWEFKSPNISYYFATFLYLLGWAVAVVATFQIDHFGLFGLHQAYREFQNQKEPTSSFQERIL